MKDYLRILGRYEVFALSMPYLIVYIMNRLLLIGLPSSIWVLEANIIALYFGLILTPLLTYSIWSGDKKRKQWEDNTEERERKLLTALKKKYES